MDRLMKMKAIIVKETRENLRWAGLIFLITSGLLALGLYDQFNLGMSLLGRTFLALCMLMYPAAGLTIGLIQIFQDSRKGRWQFITHRPVSRDQLLAGKVLAGTALYLAATAIPLAIVIFWVSAPGHIPGPFSWDMTEPALAYLLSGLMWYAAGLLIAARTAQWIGSRIIPLGAALLGAFAIQACAMTLLQSIAITLVCAALILTAAWGVFIAGGETPRSPRWAKSVIGFTLTVGWIFVIIAATALGGGVIQMFLPPSDSSYQLYGLTRDGEVRIWTYGNGSLEKIQDLSGHALPITPDERLGRTDLSARTLFFPQKVFGEESFIFQAMQDGFLRPETHVASINSPTSGNWFYLVMRRTVEGFDRQTNRYLGSLGPAGFRGPDQPPEPYSKLLNGLSPYPYSVGFGLFAFPDAVYDLNIPERSVRRIFAASSDDPAITAIAFTIIEHVQEIYVVATQKFLHILTKDHLLMTVPIEYNYLKNNITVGQTISGQFVVAYGLEGSVGYAPVTVSIYQSNGILIRRTDIPITPQPLDNDFDTAWQEIGALTLAPQAFFGVVFVIKWHYRHSVPANAIAILLLFAAGYAAISFAMLRARHATRRQFHIWVPLVACLGLTGLLLLISMLDKVSSVRCPSCGRRRLLSESACPHCHIPAALPPMEGIELFDPAVIAS